MKHFILLFACIFTLFFAIPFPAEANHFVGINLTGGFPQKDFRNNADKGWGGSVGYAYGFGGDLPVNLLIGGDFSFLIYGHETFTKPFSNTIKRVKVDVETTNQILLFDFTSRFVFTTGFVRPYIEWRGGLSYLYTDSKIKDQFNTSEPIASTENFSDVTLNSAIGGGFTIPVFHSESGYSYSKERPFTVLIDFKFLYWQGGEAEYLRNGSIGEDPNTGDLVYDVKKSKTDMTSDHIGVVFEF